MCSAGPTEQTADARLGEKAQAYRDVGVRAAIAPKMAALRNRLGRHADHMEKSYLEHIEIASAVGQGDRDQVLELLKPHIGRKEGSYWLSATADG